MKTKITAIRERLLDGADLVIDFATLGEYGCETSPPPAICDAGRTHEATTALERRTERLERFAA